MLTQFAAPSSDAIPLHVVSEDALEAWLDDQTETTRNWISANGFTGVLEQALIVPSENGGLAMALAGHLKESVGNLR